jgi:hypothetical protein
MAGLARWTCSIERSMSGRNANILTHVLLIYTRLYEVHQTLCQSYGFDFSISARQSGITGLGDGNETRTKHVLDRRSQRSLGHFPPFQPLLACGHGGEDHPQDLRDQLKGDYQPMAKFGTPLSRLAHLHCLTYTRRSQTYVGGLRLR